MSNSDKPKRKRLKIKIPSSIKGLQPTEWGIQVTGQGLKVKKRGARKGDTFAATWRTVIGILMVHGSKHGIHDNDAKSHLKQKTNK